MKKPLALLGALALSSCATPSHFTGERSDWEAVYQGVRSSLGPLAAAEPEQAAAPPTARGLPEYFAYYGLDSLPASTRASGWLEQVDAAGEPLRIAAHRFDPPEPRGSLLLVHGYFDHAGNMRALAERLLEAGWSLLVCDLPGHGFSDGPYASVDDFSTYGRTVAACAAYMETAMPAPRFALGHSTGCSAILEYGFQREEAAERPAFDGAVFFGPLVRIRAWPWVRVGEAIARPIGFKPRRGRSVSRNEAYLDFLEKDWLGRAWADGGWIRALEAWNERFAAAPRLDGRFLLIQGDDDQTVDWKWGIPQLQAKLPAAELLMVPSGGHLLPNELEQTELDIMAEVEGFLGE